MCAHTTGRLTRSKALAKSSTSGDRSLVLLERTAIKSFHLEQTLPHGALSLHSCRQWRPNQRAALLATSTPLVLAATPTNESKVGRSANGAFARDVLRNKEIVVVQAYCGHLPHCSTFSKNATPFPFVATFGVARLNS